MQRLQLQRLDLVQFHWWDYAIPGYLEALEILYGLREEGKIDQIGVTNFDAEHLGIMLNSGFDLLSAQVQYSLLDHRPAQNFTTLCQAHDVHLLCYGVLAGGFITEQLLGKLDPGDQLLNRSLAKYRLIIDEFGGWDLFQTLLATLHDIGQKHHTNLSTIAMRYMLDQPQVAAIIVGARYARYLAETLRGFDIALSLEDTQRIANIVAQSHGPNGPVYGLERDRNGRHGRIMKYNLNG